MDPSKNRQKRRKDLLKLRQAVKEAPIILCSTHGTYDRSKDPVKWIVPENTFIFEAQTIGDLTLTNIDKPLWELLQGGRRWGFMRYLMSDYRSLKKHGVGEEYKKTFANLLLYKPGDEIYERVLSIGGGRHDTSTKKQIRHEGSRITYEGMGFYRFDPIANTNPYRGYGRRDPNGFPNTYEILPGLQRQLVEDARKEITDHSFVNGLNGIDTAPRFRSGEEIKVDFTALKDVPSEKYRIFIFSSCAAVEKDSSSNAIRRWTEIATLQEQRKLEALEMGLTSLLGGHYGSTVENVKPSKRPRTNVTSSLRFKNRQPAIFAPNASPENPFSMEDTDLDAKYLFEANERVNALANLLSPGSRKTRKLRKTP